MQRLVAWPAMVWAHGRIHTTGMDIHTTAMGILRTTRHTITTQATGTGNQAIYRYVQVREPGAPALFHTFLPCCKIWVV